MIEEVVAPAKLTVSLRIVGVRDDGYHLIDAEMVTLGLADVLSIDPTSDGLMCIGPYRDDVPLDETNLVAAALRLADRTAAVVIDKHIPPGAGLGGGSADAAAVLRWAGYRDLLAACRLGADVPFCLAGGRARVEGIGEIVTPLPPLHRLYTLVLPPLRCSTPAVYAAWDAMSGPTGDGPNDLLAAAVRVSPELGVWIERVTAAVGVPPMLAGSGSTLFLEGHVPELADALPGARVVMTTTSD